MLILTLTLLAAVLAVLVLPFLVWRATRPASYRALTRITGAEIVADLGDYPADDCPTWCGGHHPPGVHRRAVDVLEHAGDPGGIWVELAWCTPTGGPPVGEPEVTLVSIVGVDEQLLPLEVGQAAMLAATIAFEKGATPTAAWGRALSGDAGWLASALARAAVMAGYEPCDLCGTPGARQQYDQQSGELVALCGSCHHEALVGGAR
ncbi:hypothetical protein [Thermomonospora amylolytica]|uniref:hypothetical protein n=1 Tax=Thermomonospora amylolytica TaxID=1411117 RepID=UPI000E6C49F2|nr:hypothetical protein [Thermomonospora amylolytica]